MQYFLSWAGLFIVNVLKFQTAVLAEMSGQDLTADQGFYYMSACWPLGDSMN